MHPNFFHHSTALVTHNNALIQFISSIYINKFITTYKQFIGKSYSFRPVFLFIY